MMGQEETEVYYPIMGLTEGVKEIQSTMVFLLAKLWKTSSSSKPLKY